MFYSYLDGKAASWYSNTILNKPIIQFKDAVYAELLGKFDRETPEILLGGYRNRKLKNGEKMSDYIADMTALLCNSDQNERAKARKVEQLQVQ